jgi:hypothetical protein
VKPKYIEAQDDHLWVANSDSTWRRGNFIIHMGVKNYSVWYFGVHSRKIGDASTFKDAAALCGEMHG